MSLTRIGSQLFINRNDTPEMAREWVDGMNEVGLKVIRLFMMWDLVQPRKGCWDFEVFDAVFDQADKHQMGVVPTLFFFTPPGWMRQVRSCQGIEENWTDEYIEAATAYVDTTVAHYANHPALDSWIIWNEASLTLKPHKRMENRYREFLESYHGSIEAYNRLSYHQFSSFDEIVLETEADTDFWKSHVEQLDWERFNRSQLLYWITYLRDRVREGDGKNPIHVNPHALASNHTNTGQEVWEEGRIMDFLGCSAHPVWHFTRFDRKAWPQAIAMSTILMRSASRSDTFWLSELQAGPAIDSGVTFDTPTAEDLKIWLWTGIATGAEAIVYWCFNDRDDGAEAGEWRLMGPTGKATKRSKATTEVCQFLEEHKSWFDSSKALRPKVQVLHSTPSRTFASLAEHGPTHNPRTSDSCDDAICGAWTLLDDLNVEAGFVDETLVETLDPTLSPVLICPNVTCVERDGLISDLHRYVQEGGTLIVDGAFAWKDHEGWILRDKQEDVQNLLGADRVDITCFRNQQTIQNEDTTFDAWFLRVDYNAREDTEVLGTWSDGDAAILKHNLGKGTVITLSSCLFQKYFVDRDERIQQVISKLLPSEVMSRSIQLVGGGLSSQIRTAQLESDAGELYLFINDGEESSLDLNIHKTGTLYNLKKKSKQKVNAGGTIEVQVPAYDCLVLGLG